MKGCRCLFFVSSICCAVALWGCDLQPKIASIPDSIGEFISERYPALLADPVTQPEIYNSAVTDYGVYASPELYGAYEDYLVYANIEDYTLPPQDEPKTEIISGHKTPEKNVLSEFLEHNEAQKTDEQSEQPEQESTDYLIIPDYVKPKDVAIKNEKTTESNNSDLVVVVRGDTLYSIAKKNGTSVSELAKINSLKEPYTLSVGQKLKLRSDIIQEQKSQETKITPAQSIVKTEKTEQIKDVAKSASEPKITPTKTMVTQPKLAKIEPVKSEVSKTKTQVIKQETAKSANVTRVAVQDITVAPGDTLYSLSRKYEIPLNDLAVMNKITSPFTLSVGQKLKVPKFNKVEDPPVKQQAKKTDKQNVKTSKKIEPTKNKKTVDTKTVVPTKQTQKTKTIVEPKKQVQKISARSASKFSWPIRGRILSQYGAKNGGLFNDGINISANMGATVKAAENGVVAYAGNEVKGMGNLIIIQHSDGWMTVYAHLDSMSVRRGSKVSVGQQIGKIGKTGKVDKPQLHFELRKGTKAYNPISYLKK